MSVVSKEISQIRVYGFPLGQALLHFGHLSLDRVTLQSLKDIRDVSQKSGIIQMDAHRSQFDIMASMSILAKVVPDLEYAAGLMAAKWKKADSGSRLVSAINRHEHLQIDKVIRYEDSQYVSPEEYKGRKLENLQVLERFLGFVDRPHAVGNIAPYGSRKNPIKQEYLKNGPLEMAREHPYVVSWSEFSPRFKGFRLFLSPLILPEGDIPEEALKSHLQAWFLSVRERVDYFSGRSR